MSDALIASMVFQLRDEVRKLQADIARLEAEIREMREADK
jgi:prefoldin subunit 5